MSLRRERGEGKRTRGMVMLYVAMILLVVALLAGLRFYNFIFAPNVTVESNRDGVIYIPTGANFDEVLFLLEHSGYIENMKSFQWVADRKGYPSRPRGGRYTLREGMSNNDIVNLLRSGRQTPVNVTFNNIRTHKELAGQLSRRLEADSLQFLKALTNEDALGEIGFARHTVLGMILPNTYEIFWTTTPEGFITRMHREYERFWNEERLERASNLGLTPLDVATLASIVDEETVREDEKSRVAGLYINRLRRGMRLQADPTIKFVIGDFTVNRILNRDLEVDSPYNTYLYAGLPPGPIRMPSVTGINAVLYYEEHNYLYMCAKDDFSGYHAFARTLQEHNRNAARYRRALNERRIFR
ncbi:endolytic transglycosylase MltG [Alkalitalea saponilacus]|uniref:Endolytic murein transglycosylase n=1 Tax=Alkalitalea saponilacus TaxID=889453 RepID=A0A1T5H1G9_9BACT|nr:endolytic transglycosylase MltG [Alkalitalea saponilacus]ASB50935.1 aminodeoxychorismate lyase [Alkalitalea saponilacus]SKC14449.1 UPF0755 protein [Alkalitalea saponilacus]